MRRGDDDVRPSVRPSLRQLTQPCLTGQTFAELPSTHIITADYIICVWGVAMGGAYTDANAQISNHRHHFTTPPPVLRPILADLSDYMRHLWTPSTCRAMSNVLLKPKDKLIFPDHKSSHTDTHTRSVSLCRSIVCRSVCGRPILC